MLTSLALRTMMMENVNTRAKTRQVATSIGEETISLMLLSDIARTRFDILEAKRCRDIWHFNEAFPDKAMLPVIACLHNSFDSFF